MSNAQVSDTPAAQLKRERTGRRRPAPPSFSIPGAAHIGSPTSEEADVSRPLPGCDGCRRNVSSWQRLWWYRRFVDVINRRRSAVGATAPSCGHGANTGLGPSWTRTIARPVIRLTLREPGFSQGQNRPTRHAGDQRGAEIHQHRQPEIAQLRGDIEDRSFSIKVSNAQVSDTGRCSTKTRTDTWAG